MTHGEELGSDVHQDSIVLTYLEGLLMHQAAEGSGTAVDKASAGRNEDDQNFNISGSAFPTCQRNGPVLSTHTYQGSGILAGFLIISSIFSSSLTPLGTLSLLLPFQ